MDNTNNSTNSIYEWHFKARPEPNQRQFDVQLGCHFEEILEMLEVLNLSGYQDSMQWARTAISHIATGLKSGIISADITDRKEFLDALCDQVVTAIGSAHCADMRPDLALEEVNRSNWSKYVNDQPVFDTNGKIKKAEGYTPPDLTGMY